MSKQFLGVIAAILVLFFGIFALSGNKSDTKSSKSGASLSQHVKGESPAGVTLVEYGDFQCPYCQKYEPTVEQTLQEFDGQVKFQFRNYPLTNLHPNAFAAARAAEAAGIQNKYWEMHNLLYQDPNWTNWTNAKNPNTFFDTYAKQIGIDVTKFKTDFASSKVNDVINADQAEGTKLGITGTPTFFINGKQTSIANSPDAFRKVLQSELKKKGATTQPAATTDATTPAASDTPTTETPANQ